jgi:hypothetical protein
MFFFFASLHSLASRLPIYPASLEGGLEEKGGQKKRVWARGVVCPVNSFRGEVLDHNKILSTSLYFIYFF